MTSIRFGQFNQNSVGITGRGRKAKLRAQGYAGGFGEYSVIMKRSRVPGLYTAKFCNADGDVLTVRQRPPLLREDASTMYFREKAPGASELAMDAFRLWRKYLAPSRKQAFFGPLEIGSQSETSR